MRLLDFMVHRWGYDLVGTTSAILCFLGIMLITLVSTGIVMLSATFLLVLLWVRFITTLEKK